MGFLEPSLQNLALGGSILLVYVLGLYVYRAFYDSLSHIPGPKLAAATLWYEFYYDVIKKGRYAWEIGKMHEKYGGSSRVTQCNLNDSHEVRAISVLGGNSQANEISCLASRGIYR